MITKVLVATDGSKTAQKAAHYAIGLAKQMNARLIVLSVIDRRSLVGQTIPGRQTARHVAEPVEDYLREAAEGYVGEIKGLCKRQGVRAEALIATGHPVEEIVKEAGRAKANLLVMGSHGKSALAATVLGSTTYGVIHRENKVPVLIVRKS